VCGVQGWYLAQVRFYSGIHDATENARLHHYWTAKLAAMGTRGIWTFIRTLRYKNQEVTLPTGAKTTVRVGREKGVDVRLALDIVRLAREGAFDVGLIFSQDQDLNEAVKEVRAVARKDDRWIKLACAYPHPQSRNNRGIDQTDWIKLDRTLYDANLDGASYWPAP